MDFLKNVNVSLLPPFIRGEPEISAMFGAMYSRSTKPMEERLAEFGGELEAVKEKLGGVVVGYGHASVLDMANVALAIENIPILAAVAIENHALFAGQETSTRYVDWSTGEFVNPYRGVDDSAAEAAAEALDEIHAYLRSVYVVVSEGVQERLSRAVLLASAEEPSSILSNADTTRAIRARSFDIARGFLPCGAITNVYWSGRLSSMLEHLGVMMVHPDPAIDAVARKIYAVLRETFPRVVPEFPRTAEYVHRNLYWPPASTAFCPPDLTVETAEEFLPLSRTYQDILAARSRKQRVPPIIGSCLQLRLNGSIDYGSFRDLNRHRPGYKDVRPPMLSSKLCDWYLHMAGPLVPPDFRGTLGRLQTQFAMCIDRLRNATEGYVYGGSHLYAYGAPLGVEVPVDYVMDLGQYIYLTELRSGMDVHPTLRNLTVGAYNERPDVIKCAAIFVDDRLDPGFDGFVLVRGKSTIKFNGKEIT